MSVTSEQGIESVVIFFWDCSVFLLWKFGKMSISGIVDSRKNFRSYHDFFGITTFEHKAGKLKEFLKKVGIIFCNRHQFLVFETDNISLKVGITFFSECVKSAILLKNEFSHFAFLNKSSILNGLSKTLSRFFTAIASLEKFINGRKVTHIITTFFRGNGANTTFLVKSHDTKKVVITILPTTLPEGVSVLRYIKVRLDIIR